MSLKSALITAATLGAIVCFAGQDPRLDYSFAAPDLDAAAAPDITATVALAVPNKTVSVNFRNAKLSDVLGWASKRGVSFVVEDQDIQDKRVTLSIVNQPLDKTMDAIANALGGRWERRGDILVFRQGFSFYTEGIAMRDLPAIPGAVTVPTVPSIDVKVQGQAIPAIPSTPAAPAQVYTFGQGQGKAVAPRAWSFSFDEKSHAELAAKIAKDVQEALKDAKVDDPKFWERFNKELTEELQKSLPKMGQFQGMTDFKKFREFEGMKDLKDMKDFKILERDAWLKENKAMRDALRSSTIVTRTVDGKKFLKSLTPAQKELQKSRGYLKMSDLTQEQREMLGVKGDGNFSFEFKMDGESVKVKK